MEDTVIDPQMPASNRPLKDVSGSPILPYGRVRYATARMIREHFGDSVFRPRDGIDFLRSTDQYRSHSDAICTSLLYSLEKDGFLARPTITEPQADRRSRFFVAVPHDEMDRLETEYQRHRPTVSTAMRVATLRRRFGTGEFTTRDAHSVLSPGRTPTVSSRSYISMVLTHLIRDGHAIRIQQGVYAMTPATAENSATNEAQTLRRFLEVVTFFQKDGPNSYCVRAGRAEVKITSLDDFPQAVDKLWMRGRTTKKTA